TDLPGASKSARDEATARTVGEATATAEGEAARRSDGLDEVATRVAVPGGGPALAGALRRMAGSLAAGVLDALLTDDRGAHPDGASSPEAVVEGIARRLEQTETRRGGVDGALRVALLAVAALRDMVEHLDAQQPPGSGDLLAAAQFVLVSALEHADHLL